MTFKLSPRTVLRNYFHAKDENRPHLMSDVFSEAAVLRMHVHTGSIAFPAITHGLDAISNVLVRQFGACYENVYTFCLERPHAHAPKFACRWLVCMSEKASGDVRVGCGRYDWIFGQHPRGLATQLTINIETMLTLPPSQSTPVFEWLGMLGYPWTSAHDLAASAPQIAALAPILQYLQADGVRPTSAHA